MTETVAMPAPEHLPPMNGARSPDALYLAANYPGASGWTPVGLLTREDRLPPEKRPTNGDADNGDGGRFLFSFVRRAEEEKFPYYATREVDDWREMEATQGLPTPFCFRMHSPKRGDYAPYIAALGLTPEEAADPFVMLERSGGLKFADWFEVFAVPEPDADGRYDAPFFLQGLGDLNAKRKDPALAGLKFGLGDSPLDLALNAVRALNPGDRLRAVPDPGGHPEAVALQTESGVHIGNMPRHLARDFRPFMPFAGGDPQFGFAVAVEKINPRSAMSIMLLCRMVCAPPRNFRPCAGPEFEILSPELRALMTPD